MSNYIFLIWQKWTKLLCRILFPGQAYEVKQWENINSFFFAIYLSLGLLYLPIGILASILVNIYLWFTTRTQPLYNDFTLLWLFDGWPLAGGGILLVCTIIIGTTFLFLTAQNPIYSLLFLISIFFSTVLLLLMLNVEFLALSLLIIYVGAIAISFLFVIMMFNLKNIQKANLALSDNFWYIALADAVLFPKVYSIITASIKKYLLESSLTATESLSSQKLFYILKYQTNDILLFSDFLYNYFSYNVFLIGMVLLTAMLGSIFLVFLTLKAK